MVHSLVASGTVHLVKISSSPQSTQITNRIQVEGIGSYRGYGRRKTVCQLNESPVGGGKNQESRIPLLAGSLNEAVCVFPWGKVGKRFVERVVDLSWVSLKWLVPPLLVVSAAREMLYTLLVKKDLLIPVGMVIGCLIAKSVGNASIDLQFQDGQTPWPLVVMASLFLVMKLLGPYYPTSAAAFLPHVANAGLVQIFISMFQLQKQASV